MEGGWNVKIIYYLSELQIIKSFAIVQIELKCNIFWKFESFIYECFYFKYKYDHDKTFKIKVILNSYK